MGVELRTTSPTSAGTGFHLVPGPRVPSVTAPGVDSITFGLPASLGGIAVLGRPVVRRWIGAQQRGPGGRALQGALMSASGRDGATVYWLQGQGAAYLLQDGRGRPIDREHAAASRARTLIEHRGATRLFPLTSSSEWPQAPLGEGGGVPREPPPEATPRSSVVTARSLQGPGLALAVSRSGTGERYLITPERRALLNTIRYAEGTWAKGGDAGYRTLFGGRLLDSFAFHPGREVRTARYASAAAGAYQFMPPTWKAVSRDLGLRDFGPQAQDQAALRLVEQRGVLGLFDRSGLTPEVLHRLAPEWAALPKFSGRSYYGQPVKSRAELLNFYRQELRRLQAAPASGGIEV